MIIRLKSNPAISVAGSILFPCRFYIGKGITREALWSRSVIMRYIFTAVLLMLETAQPGTEFMSTVSPYDPPKSALLEEKQGDMYQKGRYVVFRPEVEWPSRCLKCNQDTDSRKKLTLTYVNPWIYLSILVTVLLTIILVLIFRKKFTLNLPLCASHRKKRRNFLVFQWTMLAIMVAGFVIGGATDKPFLLGMSTLVFLIVIISAIFGRLVFAAKFKDGNIWLTGTGRDFRNSLPDFIA